MENKVVKIKKPKESNIIIGQAHFIKTVEDIHEALVNCVPGIKFGLAFCEASGPCLVRKSGTDEALTDVAAENALAVSAGHSFIAIVQNAYPINLLKAIREVPEVCSIYCATANDVEVVIAETGQGRGIIGVIDGSKSRGIENSEDIKKRKDLLRKIGYKL